MITVMITGGTGLIGRALTTALLNRNYRVIILTRTPKVQNQEPLTIGTDIRNTTGGKLTYAQWNIEEQMIDKDAVTHADYIIHLAGAGVADKRWTVKRKQEIIDSRVKTGELIVKTLKENNNNLKAIISSSGIGWYGADPTVPNPHPFIETDAAANDFLGLTCKAWQESLEPVTALNKRLVIFRTGIVLSNDGGALREFLKPLRFGAAAILGAGKQMVSWIHIEDLVNLYLTAVGNEKVNGIYNAVSPSPVSNRDLTLQLAQINNPNFFIPLAVPSAILKLVLGEMSIEVLKSATVSCRKIQDAGFSFRYPSIEGALKNLLLK